MAAQVLSLTIRSRERLRLMIIMEPGSEADYADPIRKHYLNCRPRDITTPDRPDLSSPDGCRHAPTARADRRLGRLQRFRRLVTYCDRHPIASKLLDEADPLTAESWPRAF